MFIQIFIEFPNVFPNNCRKASPNTSQQGTQPLKRYPKCSFGTWIGTTYDKIWCSSIFHMSYICSTNFPHISWHMAMDQYLLYTIFSGIFTSINPSYFDVHQGFYQLFTSYLPAIYQLFTSYFHLFTRFWPIPIFRKISCSRPPNGSPARTRCSSAAASGEPSASICGASVVMGLP